MEILLVDDNELQAETRKVILERNVASTRVASSAQEALEILRADERRSIALLVTDHLMPGMGGVELVTEVRKISTVLPVLVLSGMPDAEKSYEGKDVTFRLKPFPPAELIRLAKSLMGVQALRSA